MATAVGTVGLGATLAGGLLSAFGAGASGKAQQQMYNYQAQVAQINAQIDKQNAEWALHKGDVEGVQYGMQAAQRFGQIRAAQGASNIDVNTGSAADVQRSQRTITRMDESQIRENAAKTAYDYNVRSTMDTNQATLDVIAGKNAKLAGDISEAGSIIGTAGSISSKWLQGKQMGLWG